MLFSKSDTRPISTRLALFDLLLLLVVWLEFETLFVWLVSLKNNLLIIFLLLLFVSNDVEVLPEPYILFEIRRQKLNSNNNLN